MGFENLKIACGFFGSVLTKQKSLLKNSLIFILLIFIQLYHGCILYKNEINFLAFSISILHFRKFPAFPAFKPENRTIFPAFPASILRFRELPAFRLLSRKSRKAGKAGSSGLSAAHFNPDSNTGLDQGYSAGPPLKKWRWEGGFAF